MKNLYKFIFFLLIIFMNSFTTNPLKICRKKCRILYRIINGGTDVNLGDFPNQVSIQDERKIPFCSGTLVDLRHAVTAAHCFIDLRYTKKIFLIADELNASNPSPFRQTLAVDMILTHPYYNITNNENDIAIVRAIRPFRKTNTLIPVIISQHPQIGTFCRAAGWNLTGPANNQSSYSEYLLMVDKIMLNPKYCHRKYLDGYKESIMICAGKGSLEGGEDTCLDDSEGPLVCSTNLTGLVSYGVPDCDAKLSPTVYTDVSVFRPWAFSILNWNGKSKIPGKTIYDFSILTNNSNSLMSIIHFVNALLLLQFII